jgi:hypothetical protein
VGVGNAIRSKYFSSCQNCLSVAPLGPFFFFFDFFANVFFPPSSLSNVFKSNIVEHSRIAFDASARFLLKLITSVPATEANPKHDIAKNDTYVTSRLIWFKLTANPSAECVETASKTSFKPWTRPILLPPLLLLLPPPDDDAEKAEDFVFRASIFL